MPGRRNQIPSQNVGKRTHDALYVHISAIHACSFEVNALIDLAEAIAQCRAGTDYNVAKIYHTYEQVSLLSYEGFWEDPFPALVSSRTVNFRTGISVLRRYTASGNPPILHRKELMLAPTDLHKNAWARLTLQLESEGITAKGGGLGFRKNWLVKLAGAGVRIEDHQVVKEL